MAASAAYSETAAEVLLPETAAEMSGGKEMEADAFDDGAARAKASGVGAAPATRQEAMARICAHTKWRRLRG